MVLLRAMCNMLVQKNLDEEQKYVTGGDWMGAENSHAFLCSLLCADMSDFLSIELSTVHCKSEIFINNALTEKQRSP